MFCSATSGGGFEGGHLLILRSGKDENKEAGPPLAAFTEISWKTNAEIPTQQDAGKNPLDTPLVRVQIKQTTRRCEGERLCYEAGLERPTSNRISFNFGTLRIQKGQI